MSAPFSHLLKRSFLLKYGLLAVAVGLGLAIYGFASDQSMPERASLQKIEGQITKATQITTKRRRGGESVRYELIVKGSAPEPVTLSIPQKEISEAQVRAILPARIVAEYDGENDVYVLTAAGRPILTYEGSVRSRHDGNRGLEIMGGLLSLAGAAFAGFGFLWTKRKIAREIADWRREQEASQPPPLPAQPAA